MTFAMAEVVLKQLFSKFLQFSPHKIITPLLHTDRPLRCATPQTRQHIIMFDLELCSITLIQHLAGHTVRPFLSF